MIVIKVNYTTDQPIIKVNYDDAPIYISTSVDATYINVDYGTGGGGGGGAIWGDIIGTLSDQLDLQAALDAKVPYTGATANVDLGEYELKAGQIELDQTPTGTAGVAVTRWNDTIGSTETTLKGGNVILKNGVDLVARIVNKVTPNTTLTKAAYQAVRISGAQGQRLAVAFAQANNDNNSADTIGLVTETIATNQEGFIMTVGSLEGINTTGSLQGETWTDGDVLYLSPTVAGAITNVKPIAPQHLVVIGYVEYAHANNGKIYVKVMNGWELGELHDVDTTGATNGQVLKYNGSIWTPQNDLNTGTVTSVDLSAPTGFVVSGNPITSSGTLALSFASGYSLPTTIKQSNWDDAYTFVSAFPSQTGNSGKYLTTDGSTLSWGTVSTANIYNSDGTLTGNRTVTMGAFDLVLTGNSIPTLEINSTGNSVSTDYSVLKLSTTARTWNLATGGSTTSFNGAFYIDSGFATAPLRINTDGSTNLLTTSTRDLTVDNAGAVVTRLTINNTGASNYSVLTLKNSGASGKSYSIAVGGNTSSVGANNLYFNYDTTDTARMTLTAAGRLLLGTTTESTYLLDVNGTGRFTGNLTVTKGGSNYILFDANTNGSSPYLNFFYSGAADRRITLANEFTDLVISYGFLFSSDGTINNAVGIITKDIVATASINTQGGYLLLNGTSDNFIRMYQRGVAERGVMGYAASTSYFQIRTGGATNFTNGTLSTIFDSAGSVGIGGITSINASAILQADSVTKGFLPPRMTAAQKTAISTPATGLVIYQTDSTEGLYQYKSTGWEAIGGGGTNIYNSDGTLTGNRVLTTNNAGTSYTLSYVENASQGIIFHRQRMSTLDYYYGFSGKDVPITSVGNATNFNFAASFNGNNALINGGITVSLYNGGTEHIRLINGNLIVGNSSSFTDAGYKIDVQGTARVTGNVLGNSVSATGNITLTSGSTTFIDLQPTFGRIAAYNFSTNQWLPIQTGGSQLVLSNSTTTRTEGLVGNTAAFTGDVKLFGTSNYFGGTENNGIYAPATYSNANYPAIENNSIGIIAGISSVSNPAFVIATKISFQIGTGANSKIAQFSPTSGNFIIQNGGTFTDISSALIQMNSTTKGFLPPRMTETQKNAISTPATGLVIYQTDGTEGLYQYKSTGWSQVAGTGGGGGISRSVNVISTTTTAGASASTDYVYLISGTTTLTLPTAVGNTNRYTLKNVGTNTVTINTTSSQTIDGSTSITMAVRYTALDVISDGTNWNII